MNENNEMPPWAIELTKRFEAFVNEAKDEILASINAIGTLPSKSGRGPKNTYMMQKQREAVKSYIEVECHRHISTATNADCLHVWNENDKDWNARAKRTDFRRGYPNFQSLCYAVRYWFTMGHTAKSRRNG